MESNSLECCEMVMSRGCGVDIIGSGGPYRVRGLAI